MAYVYTINDDLTADGDIICISKGTIVSTIQMESNSKFLKIISINHLYMYKY